MLVLSGYVPAYLAGVLVSCVAAAYAYRKREAPGGTWLFAMLVATGLWALAEAFDGMVTTIAAHQAAAQFSYLGATTAPVFFFLFAIEYCSGVRRVSSLTVVSLLAIPVFSILAGYTNDLHHLVWPAIALDPFNPHLVSYEHGPIYWLVTIYGLAIGLIATILIVMLAVRVRGIYRVQAAATILAVVFPWVAELSYSLVAVRPPGLDPGVTLCVTGGVITVTMVRYRLLDLVPVRREVLVEEMHEGVIVLDEDRRVLEINPATAKLFGLAELPAPGTPALELLTAWPEEQIELLRGIERGKAVTLTSPWGRKLSVDRMELAGGQGPRQRDLYMVHDITAQVEAESALHEANATLARRVDEIEGLQHELREQATRDALTGLHNRRYLAETLERELGRAAREGYPVSLVMLDVDHFKETNDTCGHGGGDSVLRVIGAILRSGSRVGDITCRYGGDEFVVVLPNTDMDDPVDRAERWRRELSEAMAEQVADRCRPTVSLGVATYPADGHSLDEFIAAADAAVYAAKSAGRDRVRTAARPHSGAHGGAEAGAHGEAEAGAHTQTA